MKIVEIERSFPVWSGLQIWCDYCPAVFELEQTDTCGTPPTADLGTPRDFQVRDYRDHFEARCPLCKMYTRFSKPEPNRSLLRHIQELPLRKKK